MPDWFACDVIGVWLRLPALDLIPPSRCVLAHGAVPAGDPPPPS